MANMSYCRFENTVADMRDCINALSEAVDSGLSFAQFEERLSSDYERRAINDMMHQAEFMVELLAQLQENGDLSAEELEDLDN